MNGSSNLVAYASLSPHQFGPTVGSAEPVAQAPTIASDEDQVDLSWADRDLDPVLASDKAPVAPMKSPSQVLSQAGSAGYNPENFKFTT